MNRAAAFLLLVAASCATYRPGHLVAGDSSGDSANSSAQSGQSSQGSADSSKSSNDSSKSSSNSNESSQTKSESSQASTNQTTGPLVSSTVLGATLATVGVTIWGLPGGRRASLDEEKAAAYAFVRVASLDIDVDLAVGEGRFLEDVAAAAEISKKHYRTFAATLHAHRTELLALADDATLTPNRALAFLQRIGTIARTEPALAEDAARFAAGHGDEG